MKNITLYFLLLFLFSSQITIAQPLSGTYTIGVSSGNNYASFTSAINALHLNGVNGPVVFKVDTGVYNEQLNMSVISGVSSINTIKFESLSGDSNDVVLQTIFNGTGGWLVMIDSLEYVTFNSITFKIFNSSSGSGNGIFNISWTSSNITISNSILIGGQKALNDFVLIESLADTLHIYNNRLINGYYSIRANYSDIIHNQIINFKKMAVWIYSSSNIIDNYIETDVDTVANTALFLFTSDVKVIGNTIINTNIIISLHDNLMAYVYNNFFSINRPGYTNHVIYLTYMAGAVFHFNTINMIGGDSSSAAIYCSGSGIYCSNNIFNIDTGYFTVSSLSSFNGDNNLIHCSQNTFSYNTQSNTLLTNLQAFKQSGLCTNCFDSIPAFVSSTDLHLAVNSFIGMGTPNYVYQLWLPLQPPILTDIDGDIRDSVNVRPGADEYITLGSDIKPISIIIPSDTVEALMNDSLKIVVSNCGIDTVFGYQIRIDTNGVVFGSFTIQHTLFPNDIDSLSLAAFTFPKHDFVISAVTIHNGDIHPQNDSIAKQVFVIHRDLALTEIKAPLDTIATLQSPVMVMVTNIGTAPVDSFVLSYNFHGITISDTVAYLLVPTDSVTHTFSQGINNAAQDSIICATVLVDRDINLSNNTDCKQVVYSNSIAIRLIGKETDIVFYPNPTNDFLYFRGDKQNLNKFDIVIIDMYGKVLIKKQLDLSSRLSLEKLSQGIYHVIITNKNDVLLKETLIISR